MQQMGSIKSYDQVLNDAGYSMLPNDFLQNISLNVDINESEAGEL